MKHNLIQSPGLLFCGIDSSNVCVLSEEQSRRHDAKEHKAGRAPTRGRPGRGGAGEERTQVDGPEPRIPAAPASQSSTKKQMRSGGEGSLFSKWSRDDQMSETVLAAGLMALTKIDWTCTMDLNIKGRAIK